MICSKCDGKGKLRHNRMIEGRYKFGSIKCDECNGTGKASLFAVGQAIAQRLCSVIYSRLENNRIECHCKAHWFDQGMEDCDEGCHLGELECGGFIHCYYPNFIKGIIIARRMKAEELYWHNEGLKIMEAEKGDCI